MKKYIHLLSVIIIGVLTVVGTVSAATTISTDIRTDGTLSVGSSTPASNTLFQIGTSTPLFFVDKNNGYIGFGKTNPHAPLDFYNENDPINSYYDSTGVIFTGAIVQLDGLQDFTAGAHGVCSPAASCGDTGGHSGGPLMRGEANRWQSAAASTYTIDIGASRNIKAITWGTYWKDDTIGGSQFTAYNIDYSTDGTTWTNAITENNNTQRSSVLQYFAPTITARYIRITNTGASAALISNIQVLGYAKQSPQSNQPWGVVLSAWGAGGVTDDNVVLRNIGNVGLGTSSMPYKLTVDNSGWNSLSSASTLASFQNSVTAANSTSANIFFSANRSGNTMTNLAGVGGVITDITSAAYQGALAFYTANNATPTEVGRFGATGNFGVGTTTAATKLQVTSGASATTTVTIGSLGLSSSKSCINVNASDGSAGSFYMNAAHQLVAEANYCR